MSEWKNLPINIQNIKAETEKFVLIQMTHSSKYNGYSFWHPKKLVRNGSHSYEKTIGYTDEFIFHLKKYGQGKWNKNEVLDEIEITAEELENNY